VCEVDGEVVEYRDIARAYESDDGEMVIITTRHRDIARRAQPQIEVLEFVPASELDPMMYDRAISSSLTGKVDESYVLLRSSWQRPTGWRSCIRAPQQDPACGVRSRTSQARDHGDPHDAVA